MTAPTSFAIRDLAVIGDQRTAAIVCQAGAILWYCPGRFDGPSLFAELLDPHGGAWRIDMPGARPTRRRYLDVSAVLETSLKVGDDECCVTDWMPMGNGVPEGILCRRFSPPPVAMRVVFAPCPDYARTLAGLFHVGAAVKVHGSGHVLYASHDLVIERDEASFTLKRGESGWAVLGDSSLDPPPTRSDLDRWFESTLTHWRSLAACVEYSGPYESEIAASLRAIRLCRHDVSGGIVAAATSSLPEVPGGDRNWDYRYNWLRDAGMIVSALTRLGGDLVEVKRYLDFMCQSRGSSDRYPLAVFATLSGEAAPQEARLPFGGFQQSCPVRIGNDAGDQLQLDGFANVLIAAKLLYGRIDERPHWDAVEEIADFLVDHWREPDHGIWEEAVRRQYTANKVIVACALGYVAEFSEDSVQAQRWRRAAADIREFVATNCLTSEGAYAAVAGGEAVDISAALFPAWGYTSADAPEMRTTIAVLERDCCYNGLFYWRHLECADSRAEGAFLVGSFWIAQYWALHGDVDRARRLIDAALSYSNDLGLFAEEAEPRGATAGAMLGNIPQSFVHAAFIGAVIDLRQAMQSDHASNNRSLQENS